MSEFLSPHGALIKELLDTKDLRDQALAALLVESDRQSLALFGKPEDPIGGLIGRVTSLEQSRQRWGRVWLVGVPGLVALVSAVFAMARNYRDLIAPPRPALQADAPAEPEPRRAHGDTHGR